MIEEEKEEERPCAHLSCECTVLDDEEFCSPHCETADEDEEICGCGHGVCLSGKVGRANA
jgi:hypothetical protein